MINPNKVGLVMAEMVGGLHILWVLLIMAGWAQPVINFVFWAHMIQPIYVIAPLNPAAAGTLILLTFTSGFLLGFVGAVIWNRVHRANPVVN